VREELVKRDAPEPGVRVEFREVARDRSMQIEDALLSELLVTDRSGNSVSDVVRTVCPGSVVVVWRSAPSPVTTARAPLLSPARSRALAAVGSASFAACASGP